MFNLPNHTGWSEEREKAPKRRSKQIINSKSKSCERDLSAYLTDNHYLGHEKRRKKEPG